MMEFASWLMVLVVILFLVNKCIVLKFKNMYYKQKLDNNQIESSVEEIKTIIGIVRI
jgi:hypothetical protein